MAVQDKVAEQAFFDRFDREGGYDRFNESGYRRILECLADSGCAPRKGETLIDLGCGSGAFTGRLAQAYPQAAVVGMDISSGCIARARQEYCHIDFRVADAEDTGLAQGTVDVLCYSSILHHFPDFAKVAREAHRILRPGGHFFSFDPHHFNPAFWLYRTKSSPFYSPVGVTPNERLLTTREHREVFSKAGFETGAKVVSGITFASIESRRARRVLWLYNAVDTLLGATPLARLVGAWVIGWGRKP